MQQAILRFQILYKSDGKHQKNLNIVGQYKINVFIKKCLRQTGTSGYKYMWGIANQTS